MIPKGILTALIFAPIVITVVIVFCFRGKGPSVLAEGSHPPETEHTNQ